MSRVIFLLEERSMRVLLDGLLPRLLPQLNFLCVTHQGKSDLEKSIPRKLRAWNVPGDRFVVIRDNDGGDCRALKSRMLQLTNMAGRSDTFVRIACQELEAWYLGAPHALAEAYGRADLAKIAAKAKFRDPDSVDRPAAALHGLVGEFQKVSGARRMARVMDRTNSSQSFQVLLSALEQIAADETTPTP